LFARKKKLLYTIRITFADFWEENKELQIPTTRLTLSGHREENENYKSEHQTNFCRSLRRKKLNSRPADKLLPVPEKKKLNSRTADKLLPVTEKKKVKLQTSRQTFAGPGEEKSETQDQQTNFCRSLKRKS
jgi:hypothetical protein